MQQTAAAIKIEKNVDRSASAAFGLSCGYAAYVWFSTLVAQPMLGAGTGGVAVFAYLCCLRALTRVAANAGRLPLPVFDLREVDVAQGDELLLTDRYQPRAAGADDLLVLDDILAELEPDSRVVRLFDPAAMPTPTELKSRIDRHLDRSAAPEGNADAAQALHEALAELRRSIR